MTKEKLIALVIVVASTVAFFTILIPVSLMLFASPDKMFVFQHLPFFLLLGIPLAILVGVYTLIRKK